VSGARRYEARGVEAEFEPGSRSRVLRNLLGITRVRDMNEAESQAQMAELFGRERSVITKHVRNVFREGELDPKSVCARFAHTAADGKTYQVDVFNLDVIISVGYRVKSVQGTRFRIWATQVLREHLVRGYTVNQHRLRDLNQAVRVAAATAAGRDLSGVTRRPLALLFLRRMHGAWQGDSGYLLAQGRKPRRQRQPAAAGGDRTGDRRRSGGDAGAVSVDCRGFEWSGDGYLMRLSSRHGG